MERRQAHGGMGGCGDGAVEMEDTPDLSGGDGQGALKINANEKHGGQQLRSALVCRTTRLDALGGHELDPLDQPGVSQVIKTSLLSFFSMWKFSFSGRNLYGCVFWIFQGQAKKIKRELQVGAVANCNTSVLTKLHKCV
jgi:hypothetical protein